MTHAPSNIHHPLWDQNTMELLTLGTYKSNRIWTKPSFGAFLLNFFVMSLWWIMIVSASKFLSSPFMGIRINARQILENIIFFHDLLHWQTFHSLEEFVFHFSQNVKLDILLSFSENLNVSFQRASPFHNKQAFTFPLGINTTQQKIILKGMVKTWLKIFIQNYSETGKS